MPQKYVSKRVRTQYSACDVQHALDLLAAGRTFKYVSAATGIPERTLYRAKRSGCIFSPAKADSDPPTPVVTPEMVRPLPRVSVAERKAGRKKGRSKIATSTPEKDALQMERLKNKSGTSVSNTQIQGNSGIEQAKRSRNLEVACISSDEDDQDPPTAIDNTDDEELVSDETHEAAVNSPFLPVVPAEVKASTWFLVRVFGGRRGTTVFRYVCRAVTDLDDSD